jgi:hypothetical protein
MLVERGHAPNEVQPIYPAQRIESDADFAVKLFSLGASQQEVDLYTLRRQEQRVSVPFPVDVVRSERDVLPVTFGGIPIQYKWHEQEKLQEVRQALAVLDTASTEHPHSEEHEEHQALATIPDLSERFSRKNKRTLSVIQTNTEGEEHHEHSHHDIHEHEEAEEHEEEHIQGAHCHHDHHHHHTKKKPKTRAGQILQVALLINSFMPWGCPGDDLWPIALNVASSIMHITPVGQQSSSEKDMVLPEGTQIVIELKKENEEGQGRSALDVLRERRVAREEAQEKERELLENARVQKSKKKKTLGGFAKVASILGIGLALLGTGDAAVQQTQSDGSSTPHNPIVDTHKPQEQNNAKKKTSEAQKPAYSFEKQYTVKSSDSSYDQILTQELQQDNLGLTDIQTQQMVNALRNYEEIQQNKDLSFINVGEQITLPGKTTIDIMRKALNRYALVKNSTDTNFLVKISKSVYALANPQEADNVSGGVIYDATTQNAVTTINAYMQFIQSKGMTP